MYIYICISLSLSLYIYIYISVSIYIYMYISGHAGILRSTLGCNRQASNLAEKHRRNFRRVTPDIETKEMCMDWNTSCQVVPRFVWQRHTATHTKFMLGTATGQPAHRRIAGPC